MKCSTDCHNTIVGPVLDCLNLSVAIHIKMHNVVLEEKFKFRFFFSFFHS